MSERRSLEQVVRDLLTAAIESGVVAETTDFDDPDPQCRSSGELVGVTNVLQQYLEDERHDRATDG